jgi:hypothetical protein
MRLYRIMNDFLFSVTNADSNRPRCKRGRYRLLVLVFNEDAGEMRLYRIMNDFLFSVTNADSDRSRCKRGRYLLVHVCKQGR